MRAEFGATSVQLESASAPSQGQEDDASTSLERLLVVGQQNLESRAAGGALEDADGAAKGADVIAHEGEPEPRAAGDASVVRRPSAKESLEDGCRALRGALRPRRRRR